MITLGFTGDIMLSRNVGERIDNAPKEWSIISSKLCSLLSKNDFLIGNLESPIATKARKTKENSFKASPKSLKEIQIFDLLTVANNHIFDCGKEGAIETVEHLKKNKFNSIGLTNSDSQPYHVITQKDKDIAFIAAATEENIKIKSTQHPTVVEAENPETLHIINDLSKQVDYVIVLLHGGNEMIRYPEPSFRSLCKKFIDSGADIVITHHPHVIGGFEEYKDKYIFYSLGDFIFDGKNYKRRRGVYLELFLKNNEISYKLHPTLIKKDLSVDIASDKTKKKVLKSIRKVNKRMQKPNYDKTYRRLYINSLVGFQLDRLWFITRNEGIVSAFRFLFNKLNLVSYYTKNISKGDIK